MKKLLIIALALFALQVTAQEKNNKKELKQQKMERVQSLEPQDMAIIQAKKMTLALDLSQDQQDRIEKLFVKNAELRKISIENRKALKEANKKPSQEAILTSKNNRLDSQIALKRDLKEILTEDQYIKFSEMSEKRNSKGKRGKMQQLKSENKVSRKVLEKKK